MASIALLLPACQQNPPGAKSAWADVIARFEQWPSCRDPTTEEHDYRLRIQGQPAGYEVLTITYCDRSAEPSELRRRIEVHGAFAFLRGGTRIEYATKTRILTDKRGGLLRLHYESHQADKSSQVLQAGRIGDRLVTVSGGEIHRVPYEPEAIDPVSFYRSLWQERPMRAGQEIAFRAYSRKTAEYVDHRVRVIARFSPPEGGALIEHSADDMSGLVNRTWLDEKLSPVRQQSQLGRIRMESLRTADLGARALPDDPPEIKSLIYVDTAGTIERPDEVTSARYRIENLPESIETDKLNGPGQRVVSCRTARTLVLKVFRIDPSVAMTFPPKVPRAVADRWLGSTALVQADHPDIRSLARRVVRGASDSWTAALRLRSWVAEAIESDMGMNFGSATDVLRERRGDCSERSVLLTALARAAGIPARAVVGLVYHQGVFAGHMWTEVWTDDWHPVDAALGPEVVSAARIRLAVDPLALGRHDQDAPTLLWISASGARVVVEKVSYASAEKGAPPRPASARMP